MSHQAVTWAYKQEIKPATAKFVLVTLANYADGEGYCKPGQKRLASDTGMSERAVRGHLRDLEQEGLIYRQRRYTKSGHRTSDNCWLVGFAPLPAEVAAELPADLAKPTGRSCQPYRQNLPVYIKGIDPSEEPSGEPSDKNESPAADEPPPSDGEQPFDIFAQFMELRGSDPKSADEKFKGSQCRAAKNMLTRGFTASDILGCAAYMHAEPWRTGLWDLTHVQKAIGAWAVDGKPASPRARGSPRGELTDDQIDALYPEFGRETDHGDD